MYTSQYTVKFGDCPVCKAEGALMVTVRKPLPWAYCMSCRLSRSLDHLHNNSYKGKNITLLWQLQEYAISNLDTHAADYRLLNRLGIPRGQHDPLNKYFFKEFVGSIALSTLRYVLKEQNIRCVSRAGLNSEEEVLCIALQSSPGFVVGFHLIFPDAEDDIFLRTYKHRKEKAYYYPHLDTSYVYRAYADIFEYRYTAAMDVCMGGAFNAVIPTEEVLLPQQ